MRRQTKIRYKQTPWYRWRFSLGGVVVFGFLVLMAVDGTKSLLQTDDRMLVADAAVVLIPLGLAAVIAWCEWSNRKEVDFRIHQDQKLEPEEPTGEHEHGVGR